MYCLNSIPGSNILHYFSITYIFFEYIRILYFQHADLASITEGDSITIETTEIDQSENIETVTVTTDEQANKDVLPVNIFQNVSSKLMIEAVTMTIGKQTFFTLTP